MTIIEERSVTEQVPEAPYRRLSPPFTSGGTGSLFPMPVVAPPPVFNIELAQKALHHIKWNRRQWKQATWRSECGTKFCFAGFVSLAAGACWDHLPPSSTVIYQGVSMSARECAMRALTGHNPDEEYTPLEPLVAAMFSGHNHLHDLRRLVRQAAKEYPARVATPV